MKKIALTAAVALPLALGLVACNEAEAPTTDPVVEEPAPVATPDATDTADTTSADTGTDMVEGDAPATGEAPVEGDTMGEEPVEEVAE